METGTRVRVKQLSSDWADWARQLLSGKTGEVITGPIPRVGDVPGYLVKFDEPVQSGAFRYQKFHFSLEELEKI